MTALYSADLEVFKYDWLLVAKDIKTKEYTVIHNNNYEVKEFIKTKPLLAFANGKHYDQHILKAILAGADNTIIKEINDYIIAGGLGFEHWFLQQNRVFFHSMDLFDDMQIGLSVKAIEAHLGLPVIESPISFDIDRPLTEEELDETIRYCKYDVDMVETLLHLRKNYLDSKVRLGAMKGIPPEKALYMTNAKVTAAYLGAVRKDWQDGRFYEPPSVTATDQLPKEIVDYFLTINDHNIPDEELFKTTLTVDLGGCPTKYAWGGVHGSLSCYHEKATSKRAIMIADVQSYYPSLIIKYNYLSRNAESVDLFKQTYERRLAAKAAGDKIISNTLKNPLNIVSGATEQQFNDLYDPRQARGMRISGQLFLTNLIMHLLDIPTLKLLNVNTDGVMFSIDKQYMTEARYELTRWEERTKFELEEVQIKEVWIKDVNNLLFVDIKDKITTTGGYLNYGISEKGAWNINNNIVIVKKAIVEYFVHNVPVEDTINNCQNIHEFQYVAKASGKYKRAYQIIDGQEVDIQKTNRVYASKDFSHGTLYKVHAKTGRPSKQAGLPEFCIIDNLNELTLDDIDKTHYIDKAKSMINDYKGVITRRKKVRELNKMEKEALSLL